jgi:hypothetical protein
MLFNNRIGFINQKRSPLTLHFRTNSCKMNYKTKNSVSYLNFPLYE